VSKTKVNVFVHNLSAERFWEIGKPFPPTKIQTNLNIVGINEKKEDLLVVPFIFTTNYTPSIAQISVRGEAQVTGKKDELEKIQKSRTEKKPFPPVLVQTIMNVAFLESIVISRSIHVPPPIPIPRIRLGKEGKGPVQVDYRA
jgi:hypothetical protein